MYRRLARPRTTTRHCCSLCMCLCLYMYYSDVRRTMSSSLFIAFALRFDCFFGCSTLLVVCVLCDSLLLFAVLAIDLRPTSSSFPALSRRQIHLNTYSTLRQSARDVWLSIDIVSQTIPTLCLVRTVARVHTLRRIAPDNTPLPDTMRRRTIDTCPCHVARCRTCCMWHARIDAKRRCTIRAVDTARTRVAVSRETPRTVL